MTEEDETIDVSDEYSALAQLDERDKMVKEAVVAYLMRQSGLILDPKKYPDSKARANRIDELGKEAIQRSALKSQILSDQRRVLASQSIATQAKVSMEASENATIVCYLDAEMFASGDYIPLFDMESEVLNLQTPPQLSNIGFEFKGYDDFRDKFENFGTYLITDPLTVQRMLELLQDFFLDQSIPTYKEASNFHPILPYWNIVGAPKRCDKTFENLGVTNATGKIIKLRGQVSEVGDQLTVYTKIAFRCINYIDEAKTRKCLSTALVPQNTEEGLITKPKECSRCKGTDFEKLDSEKSRIEPIQRIQLQEVNLSEDPKSIMVELRGNLTDKARPGSTIEVTGILRLESIQKNSLMSSKYILAHSVTSVNEEAVKTVVSEDEVEEIKALCDSMSFEERIDYLVWSWSGHLLCDPLLKRALFLQAIGAVEEEQFGHRSGIHILIAGDPGTVKTHLLKAVQKLVPGSRMVSAEAASQAGIVAACQQVEDLYTGKKRWALTPGALALTPKEAVCCVDELNLYKSDFGDFNNALESGEVYISKVVSGRVATPCSVLAAANPKKGDRKKFVKNISFLTQLDMDITVLQRFDAIFILLDEANYEQDRAIGLSVLGRSSDPSNVPLEMEFVRKYIAYAKSVSPKLSAEAEDYIATQHAEKRQASKRSDYLRSHRQVPALRRISLAAARFDLQKVASVEHVKYAEEILATTLNEKDAGQMAGDEPEEVRDYRRSVAKLFVGYASATSQYENIDYRFVVEHAKDKGIDIEPKQVKDMLTSFSKNSETSVKRNKDGTFNYNGPQNPAYEVW